MFHGKKQSHSLDIWPGFVDALATVLMVIIFVLMTFVIAQLYMTEAMHHQETHVTTLEKKIQELTQIVSEQENINASLQNKSKNLDKLAADLNQQLAHLNDDLSQKSQTLKDKEEHNQALLTETESLKIKVDRLLKALNLFEAVHHVTESKMADLTKRLNMVFIDHIDHLNAYTKDIQTLTQHNHQLITDKNTLEKRLLTLEDDHALLVKETEKLKGVTQFDHYRSEFFSRLLRVLGNRPDMRIVGDRFVFQSEVLFDKASADLGENGKKGLDGLAHALKEIDATIPKTISWILRIDGHTDQIPIRNSLYPSNWELSAARSIAVVKYLISKGIPQERLVAAAFGEHQPLIKNGTEKDLARNRRIEFKLDQK